MDHRGQASGHRQASGVDVRRGLFDGFEGYRTPTADDYRHVLTEGLVVPDTNVLLNLYRYNAQARGDLFAVLDGLGERLWVPHQVLVEFWRNRESALRDPPDTAMKAVEELKGHCQRAIGVMRRWAHQVSLPDDRVAELETALDDGFATVTNAVEDLIERKDEGPAWDTSQDPVLRELERILRGRVGDPLDEKAHKDALVEGKRRVVAGLPPGFKDKQKGDEAATGDFLVWAQVLREAERRKCDVLLVTGDVKEDWWRKDRGQLRGPRVELVDELTGRVGVRLFMLRPQSLLLHASKVLDIEVPDSSVQDVKRVDSSLAEEQLPADEGAVGGGWTAESMGTLLSLLAIEGPVQEAVIRLAAERDGFVSRDEVYELGDYDADRTLKGFTKPVNRVVRVLQARGSVPHDTIDVLSPVYDPEIKSFQRAAGFRVPPELILLIRGA
jgi:PIN like domain